MQTFVTLCYCYFYHTKTTVKKQPALQYHMTWPGIYINFTKMPFIHADIQKNNKAITHFFKVCLLDINFTIINPSL